MDKCQVMKLSHAQIPRSKSSDWREDVQVKDEYLCEKVMGPI